MREKGSVMTAGREETVDDKEILQIFKESEDPFLFTGEVADVLGFSNAGTLKRLHDLNNRDMLNSKKSGQVPAWWLTDRGRAYLAGDYTAGSVDASDPD